MTRLNVVIAGASGFLGTHLTRELVSRGHAVVALVRRPTSAPDESSWDPYAGVYDRDVIERADVVVNLAGTPTIGNPHSKKWARDLRESRVTTTRVLAEAIAGSERRPAFLAGNAIAWYGDHGDAGRHRGDRQRRRQPAHPGHPRVAGRHRLRPSRPAPGCCVLRTAPVMDRRVGAAEAAAAAVQARASAPGSATAPQHMAMISLRDWVGGVAHLAEHDDVSGPVNLCCPETPTNAEFTAALARAVERPAFLAVPSFAIRLGAGPLAPEALGSLNLRPDGPRGRRLLVPRPHRPRGAAHRAQLTRATRHSPATTRSTTVPGRRAVGRQRRSDPGPTAVPPATRSVTRSRSRPSDSASTRTVSSCVDQPLDPQVACAARRAASRRRPARPPSRGV